MSETSAPAAAVTPAMARTFIERARAGHYPHGVLGVRARPSATNEESFVDSGQPVRIVPAASALAVREAIRGADPTGWLVVVTDRSDEDLGAGLLAQFIWQRLRHPDPWQALQQRFRAQSIDPRLVRIPQARDVAAGLLELAPAEGWPPAPAGVLTRDHALGSLARAELGLSDGPVDLIAVLQWSTTPGLQTTIARLRSRGGDHIVDAVLDWIAQCTGEGQPLVSALVARGAVPDLVPVGVVLDCLLSATDRQRADLALARLEHRWGDVPRAALNAVGRLSAVVVSGLLGGRSTEPDALRLLSRADDLVREAQATQLASGSGLLATGLTQRLRALAAALRATPPDPFQVDAAWSPVAGHELAAIDARVKPALAGVRLARWLAEPDVPASDGLAGLAARHLAVDAWVDSAINDAETGVDDHELAEALERVLRAAHDRRDAHDLAFAAALADQGCAAEVPGVLPLERLLPEVVAPLARRHPTLLLVLDGMSAGVATEVIGQCTASLGFDLVERLLPGQTGRTPALAVLPSLTEVSRASLFSGRLTTGQQDSEKRNFADATGDPRLGGSVLFHKRDLDSARGGFAVADDVRQAIEDVSGHLLVAAVLNTIDDTLDRTDPGGTDWTVETIKHLPQLLRLAQRAGRLVIITADHGHVVERRRGTQRGTGLSTRHRSASGTVEPDEVLVSGPRVLTDEHRAILAVNERLRYGPLKAGYHGGASPAEVVVPVIVLVPSGMTTELEPAPIAEPAWWDDRRSSGSPSTIAQTPLVIDVTPQPDLFTSAPVPGESSPGWGDALVASHAYRDQKKLVQRVAVSDDQVARLVDALVAAPDRRLEASKVAPLLGVSMNRVPMAMSQLSKLINIEGYPVVATDPATNAVSLDLALLTEQYGVRG